MFSFISKAFSNALKGRSAIEHSPSPDQPLETCVNAEAEETTLSYVTSYDGDIQPQYGQDIASENMQVSHIKSVTFHVGDGVDDSCESGTEESCGTRTINGKITHVYSDYGLIDNSIHFRFDTILYNAKPKVGLKVEATVESGGHKDVGLRASEVVISKTDWDDSEGTVEEIEWHIGKVTRTENSSGWIDDILFYDQDASPYGFLPHRGDWLIVEMKTNTETGTKVVKTVRPLREKHFKGFVTHVYPGYGFIDGTIYFSKKVCEQNYTPQRDDQVEGSAIESEMSKGRWRAVSVSLKKQPSAVHAKQFPAHSFEEGERMKNKNNILVTVSGEFSRMNVGQENRVTVYVRNAGEKVQKLMRVEAVSLLSDVLVALDTSTVDEEKTAGLSILNQAVYIEPGSKISLIVAVTARSVGKSVCQIILNFETFSISRPVPITVRETVTTSQSSGRLSGKDRWMQDHAMVSSGRGPAVLPGVRPARTSNPNLPVKLGFYPVSKRLKEWYAEKRDITQLIPELKEALSLENYSTYFSALLHIEELKMEVDMREFDIERASMYPRGEFLSLEVPGLAEGRPSVLIGDKIILTDPYEANSQRYEGYVHEVHDEDVFLKFHPHFHERYGAEIFSVMFTFSRTPLRRCHQAAEISAVLLGKQVLFPTDLKAKPPQVEISFATIHRSVIYPGRPRTIIKLPAPKNIPRCLPSETKPSKQESSLSSASLQSIIEKNEGSSRFSSSQDVRFMRKPIKGMNKDGEELKFLVPNALMDGVASTLDMSERGEGDVKAEFFNNKLNARQRSAVMRVLKGEGRPTPYILFGPPGTGKTITVVESILQIHCHLASSRILACTPSNSAADLLAERLHQSGAVKKIDMIRLNSFRRSEEDIPECIHQYCSNGEELQAVSHHRIIISTCATGGQFYSLGLKPGHFTHVIIDEAGQATEPEALVGMGLAAGPDGQVVLAGDPMQLGPVLASSQAGELGLEQSLLERLMKRDLYQRDSKTYRDHGGYNPLLVTKLVDNYRSHPALLKLPSQCFYHDELNACANIDMREMACQWKHLPNKNNFPILFHGIQGADLKEGNSPSWCNPAEAVQAVTYLQDLLSCTELNLKETDIGIITPYRKQVEKLNLLLDSVDIMETKVGSVEEFQGQERPVIIISTVRSSSSLMAFDIRHQLGFLSNPKRFNVAITRPQALLIVIGNPHLLVNDIYWRALLKYCLKNNAYVGCEPPSDETMKRLDGQEEEEPQERTDQEMVPEEKTTEEMGQDGMQNMCLFLPVNEDAVAVEQMQMMEPSKTNNSIDPAGDEEKENESANRTAPIPLTPSPIAPSSIAASSEFLTDVSYVTSAESLVEREAGRQSDAGSESEILPKSTSPNIADDLSPKTVSSSSRSADSPARSSLDNQEENVTKEQNIGAMAVNKETEEEIWDVYDSDASEVTSSIPWSQAIEDLPNRDTSSGPSRGWYASAGEPLPDLLQSNDTSIETENASHEIYPSHTLHLVNSTLPGPLPCLPITGLRYEKDSTRDDRMASKEGHSEWKNGKDSKDSHGEHLNEQNKLVLQKRTLQVEHNLDSSAGAASIFGGAKPVDTASNERDIIERLEKEKMSTGSLYTTSRERQYIKRSVEKDGRTSFSSSGSESACSRPFETRTDSEPLNEEVFSNDDHSLSSPKWTSNSKKQRNNVRNRNRIDQRSNTSRRGDRPPSESNGGWHNENAYQHGKYEYAVESSSWKVGSSKRSPMSFQDTQQMLPRRTPDQSLPRRTSDQSLQRRTSEQGLPGRTFENKLSKSEEQNLPRSTPDQILQRTSDQNVLRRNLEQGLCRTAEQNFPRTPEPTLPRNATDQILPRSTLEQSLPRRTPEQSLPRRNSDLGLSKTKAKTAKSSVSDSQKECMRVSMPSSPSRDISISENDWSDEDTGEDFSGSSWAPSIQSPLTMKGGGYNEKSGVNARYQGKATTPSQHSTKKTPADHSRTDNTEKLQGSYASSSQQTYSSNDSEDTEDFVKFVSRGRGLTCMSNASGNFQRQVGNNGSRCKSSSQPQEVINQNTTFSSPGVGRAFNKPRQISQEQSPGYQMGYRGNVRGFGRGQGRGRGRGRGQEGVGRGLLATNFNFGK